MRVLSVFQIFLNSTEMPCSLHRQLRWIGLNPLGPPFAFGCLVSHIFPLGNWVGWWWVYAAAAAAVSPMATLPFHVPSFERPSDSNEFVVSYLLRLFTFDYDLFAFYFDFFVVTSLLVHFHSINMLILNDCMYLTIAGNTTVYEKDVSCFSETFHAKLYSFECS